MTRLSAHEPWRRAKAKLSPLQGRQRILEQATAPTPESARLASEVTEGAPALTTKLGTITATVPTWTDPNIAFVEVHQSPVQDFEPTYGAGGTLRRRASQPGEKVVIGGLTRGSVQYVRCVDVSRAGVKAAPGPQASITVQGVEGPDIEANTVTANELIAGVLNALIVKGEQLVGAIITGGLFRTAAFGQRVEIDSAARNEIRYYSGHSAELQHGHHNVYAVDTSPGVSHSVMQWRPPYVHSGDKSLVILRGRASDYSDPSFFIMGTEAVISNARVRLEGVGAKFQTYGRWYNAGSSGPIFFNNGWANDDDTNPAGGYLDAAGVVHLRGRIKSGTIGARAFTLPADLRPSRLMDYAVPISGGGTARLEIAATGTVTVATGGAAAQTWTSLGCSFPTW